MAFVSQFISFMLRSLSVTVATPDYLMGVKMSQTGLLSSFPLRELTPTVILGSALTGVKLETHFQCLLKILLCDELLNFDGLYQQIMSYTIKTAVMAILIFKNEHQNFEGFLSL